MAESILAVVLYLLVGLLCVCGILMSCVTLSGTWAVTVAAAVAMCIPGEAFPGVWTLVGFALVSALVEAAEAVAGVWGVRRRGGSAWAGLAAFAGGLVGLLLGGLIPIPLIGSLVGMTVGSFGLVFAVERLRLKRSAPAASIAWGTVLARTVVIFLKVTVTLAMTAFLLAGLIKGGRAL